jgi:uncharacterized membrane protein YebE (DUF533 family)
MFPENALALNEPTGILTAVKSSMAIHPVIWTLGAVAVVGAIGYFAFFRKAKPATVTAAAAAA